VKYRTGRIPATASLKMRAKGSVAHWPMSCMLNTVAEASQYAYLPATGVGSFPNESVGEVWLGLGPKL
jgi:hypothetical protein